MELSNFAYTLTDVPQGSALGLLFFLLYVNDFPLSVICFIYVSMTCANTTFSTMTKP